ncbi:hypothetical protein [uncultured Sphingomonas sp.]|uniref:hypothetical protein n=1 Tax=uncultured Sphingomonas sp. TaxID=158754 RepID=UPI00374A95A4
MFAALLLLSLIADDPPGDVLVVSPARACSVSIADEIVSDRAFKERAREWAVGRPVTVVVARDAERKCLSKIMFRLAKHGVTRAIFVSSLKEVAAVPDFDRPLQASITR